jgi:hypothetical protein
MISIEIDIVHDMEERGVRVDEKEVDGIEGKFWDDFLGVLWGFIPVVDFVWLENRDFISNQMRTSISCTLQSPQRFSVFATSN